MMFGIEKVLTDLVMPCGLMWLGLIALAAVAWRKKQRTFLVSLLMLLVVYTIAGNVEFSRVVLAWLERDYVEIDPFEQGSFDAVIVLGGGTDRAPSGQPQVATAGDRVILGARLYHAGRTQRLLATGRVDTDEIDRWHDSAEKTSEIWRQLAVPEDKMILLSGRNTREEMLAIRQIVTEHPEWKRLGLVTSAWHMRRALRLAEKNHLSLEPLPANFLGTDTAWTFRSLIIPNGRGFLRSQLALREILAGLVGK